MTEWKVTEIGVIPNEWEVKLVEELVNDGILAKPMDGNHGNIHPKGNDFTEAGIPFIMATDVNNGHIDLLNCKFIKKEQADSLQKGFSVKGDVLLTHKASLGRTAIVKDNKYPYIMLTPQVTYYRVLNKDKLNNKYLKYYFDSPIFQGVLYNHGSSGSTRAYVGITAQRELPILLPPIDVQLVLSETLSSLDDKIDLLHHHNKTLEQMAETLFRQWFVFNASEKWESRPLSSIATFLNGLACQKYPPEKESEKLPVLKIKELRNGISKDCDYCTSNVKAEYIIENGDVIFSWSASLMVKIWNGERCVLNQHLFKVTSDEFPKWYYYLWCKHHLNEFINISASHATTMGHIKRRDLDDAMVLVPKADEIKYYSEIITPLIDKIIFNNKQLSNLSMLRDTILPKLMSGEAKVEING